MFSDEIEHLFRIDAVARFNSRQQLTVFVLQYFSAPVFMTVSILVNKLANFLWYIYLNQQRSHVSPDIYAA